MNGILPPSEWHSTKSNKYPEMENLGAWRSWEDELVGKHPENLHPNEWHSSFE